MERRPPTNNPHLKTDSEDVSVTDLVISRTRELNQAQVPKKLQLLSYFRSHISIVRVNILQVRLKFIQLLK